MGRSRGDACEMHDREHRRCYRRQFGDSVKHGCKIHLTFMVLVLVVIMTVHGGPARCFFGREISATSWLKPLANQSITSTNSTIHTAYGYLGATASHSGIRWRQQNPAERINPDSNLKEGYGSQFHLYFSPHLGAGQFWHAENESGLEAQGQSVACGDPNDNYCVREIVCANTLTESCSYTKFCSSECPDAPRALESGKNVRSVMCCRTTECNINGGARLALPSIALLLLLCAAAVCVL